MPELYRDLDIGDSKGLIADYGADFAHKSMLGYVNFYLEVA